MARARSPNRDKAKEMYLNSNGDIKLIDIAKELNIKDSQVRKWKSQDNWDDKLKGNVTIKNKGNVTNGCKKRIGAKTRNKEGSRLIKESYPTLARPNNKNAVTTGEFETIFFDELEDEELSLIEKTPIKKIELLKQEIQLLTVRERRMLKRISSLKDKEMTLVSSKSGIEKGMDTDISEFEGTLGQIQNIEEALTRVQDKKQKAIDLLHKFEIDEQKLELTVMKLEIDIIKQGGQDEEVEDDGFMDAMKSEVGAVWDEY